MITINAKSLKSCIVDASRFVWAGGADKYAMIGLGCADGEVRIVASNGNMCVSVFADVIDSDGMDTVYVNGAKMKSIVSALRSGDDVTLSVERGGLVLRQGSGSYRIEITHGSIDLSDITIGDDGIDVVVGAAEFSRGIELLSKMPSDRSVVPWEGAVSLSVDNGQATMIAGCGKRVGRHRIDVGCDSTVDGVLLPIALCMVVTQMIRGTDEVCIVITDRGVKILMEDKIVISRVLSGCAPDVSRLMAVSSSGEIVVNSHDMSEAIKRVGAAGDSAEGELVIDVSDGEVLLSSNDAGYEVIDCGIACDDFICAMNSADVISILSSIGDTCNIYPPCDDNSARVLFIGESESPTYVISKMQLRNTYGKEKRF